MINVSGHRIGTAEVEGALASHPAAVEAAVVPVNHDIKGQGIYAFVSLMSVRPHSDSPICEGTLHWWLDSRDWTYTPNQ